MEEQITFKEFKKKTQKVNETRTHKIRNSLGVYDAYKWLRKNKWLNIGRPLTEKEFYAIVRNVNNLLAYELIDGRDIKFPAIMGCLELRKYQPFIGYKNNKLKVSLPVDWDATLKLWYEDKEAYANKTLVKIQESEIFQVLYNRADANYENKSFMQFSINRQIKRILKKQIKSGRIDAFLN